MTMRSCAAVLTVLLLTTSGCSGTPPPVPLHTGADGVKALQGSWQGQYRSDETGRSGWVRFELAASGDTARGDVLMRPADRDEMSWPADWEGAPTRSAPTATPQYLSIHFVRCDGRRVQGTLATYRDPETGHPLVTTFHGQVAGDSIGGRFISYDRVTERRTEGVWYARRRGP